MPIAVKMSNGANISRSRPRVLAGIARQLSVTGARNLAQAFLGEALAAFDPADELDNRDVRAAARAVGDAEVVAVLCAIAAAGPGWGAPIGCLRAFLADGRVPPEDAPFVEIFLRSERGLRGPHAGRLGRLVEAHPRRLVL